MGGALGLSFEDLKERDGVEIREVKGFEEEAEEEKVALNYFGL